jgi:DNA-binding winged helix-turn-helix (wHTH) protein
MADRECYRVGDLTLDVRAMRITRNGEPVSLPPLSFELFVNLVRRAPDVVSRDDLLQATWKDIVVGPETLKQRIKLLREALHDDPRSPRYVATIRGRGYQLVPLPVSLANIGWRSRLEGQLGGLIDAIRHRRNRRIGVVIVGILILTVASISGFDATARFLG